MASHNYLPVATEEQDASRRPSNEEPSEDISSILEEARNDDGLPHDLSPLLDDSTIGVKDLAAAAASRDRQSAATRQPDVESATGSPPSASTCCRATVILNLLLTVILLGLIAILSFELGPVIRDEYWGTNQTSPGLPSVAETFGKIKEGFAALTDSKPTGPPLYDPAIFPWAEDPRSFLETVEKGQAAVAAARKALWDARMPNSETIFPHVDVWNEEHLTKKFNRALLGQGKFVIGVMGTSVTAGHDNLFNQSFPVVWGQLMQEAFTAAGVELVVRNHAMGWNPIHPSYFCVGEIAGQDADVTMWEFGMMAGANEDMEIEQFIRSAILMPGQPHILICDPGEGQRKPKEGEVLEKRTNTPPAPWKKAAMDWYIDDGFSFATNQLMQSFMFLDHLPEYQYGTFYLKDKVTDRPAGWHPGPHGHRFRAEILAWNYLGFFEKALAGVHEKIAAKEADLSSLLPEKLVVPPPTQCQPELCGELAQCSTSFEPREGGGLMERVIFPKEVPFVKDSEQARTNAVKTWHEQLYFCDVAAVDHMLDNGWNYLDRKYIIEGDKNAGPLQLEFESTTENYFVVCSAPGNAYLCKEGTVWKIDDEVVRCLDTEAAKTAGTPFVDAPCYISDRKIPAGKHIFELERLASDTKDEVHSHSQSPRINRPKDTLHVLRRGEFVALGVVPKISGGLVIGSQVQQQQQRDSSNNSMTTAYAGAGLRWAFQALNVRNEVVGVMEEMLATIEHWKLVNDMECSRIQYLAEHAKVLRLQQAIGELEAVQAQHVTESLALKKTARQVRDQFVANLLSVSKELRATQLRNEAVVSRKVPTLEKELEHTKQLLNEAQERLRAADAEKDAGSTSRNDAAGSRLLLTNDACDANGATNRSSSPSKSSLPSPLSPPPSLPTPPSLHTLNEIITTLEESLVLRVFSFMNASDVLAMSEVCKAFNERIGLIFGHKHEDEDGDEGERAKDEEAIPTTSTAVATVATASDSNPAIPSLSPSSSFLKNYLGGTADVLSSSFSSLLPPPSSAGAMARSLLGSPIETRSSFSGTTSSGGAPPLASMASKLTNAELKGILALTERVKKMEALVVQFQVENEDVRARLEQAEGVRDLLVGKLSETEKEVKSAREVENDKERQRVVDQEVIGFLDGRVQELEGGLKTTVGRLIEVEEKARREVAQWQEQVRMLQDMLGFERRRAEENEGQWRQQKKILAKEVKNLRNEVLMRQKERDAYRDELHNVRLGGGGGGVSGGGGGQSRR